MSLKRRAPNVYTPAERVALVTEVQARQRRDSSKSIDAIARQLGITGPTYFNWLRRGVHPAPGPTAPARTATTSELREKAARRYDPAQRQALLAEIARRTANGETQRDVLAALDLGRATYRRWLELAEPPPAFRAVTLAAGPEASVSLAPVPASPLPPAPGSAAPTLTLVAPGGYRVEGLAVESAAALLRALA